MAKFDLLMAILDTTAVWRFVWIAPGVLSAKVGGALWTLGLCADSLDFWQQVVNGTLLQPTRC